VPFPLPFMAPARDWTSAMAQRLDSGTCVCRGLLDAWCVMLPIAALTPWPGGASAGTSWTVVEQYLLSA
jgi:hypothetical protein